MVMVMINNRCAFEHYEGNNSELIAYEDITGRLIFNLKLSDNFRRNVRFVADGYLVETPASIIYSTVALRDSVIILLLRLNWSRCAKLILISIQSIKALYKIWP